MARNLKATWDQLIQEILDEFARASHDPAMNFEHDFEKRKIRLRSMVGDGETWWAWELSESDLASINVADAAAHMYALIGKPVDE